MKRYLTKKHREFWQVRDKEAIYRLLCIFDIFFPDQNFNNKIVEKKIILQEAKKEVIVCTNADEMNIKAKLFQQTFELLKKENIKVKIALSGDEALIKNISEKLGIKI